MPAGRRYRYGTFSWWASILTNMAYWPRLPTQWHTASARADLHELVQGEWEPIRANRRPNDERASGVMKTIVGASSLAAPSTLVQRSTSEPSTHERVNEANKRMGHWQAIGFGEAHTIAERPGQARPLHDARGT